MIACKEEYVLYEVRKVSLKLHPDHKQTCIFMLLFKVWLCKGFKRAGELQGLGNMFSSKNWK